MNTLRNLKEQFSREGILIAFNGAFTHNIIEEIGNAAKQHMEHKQLTRTTITDVFAVYIEQAQNVRNYMIRQQLEDTKHNSAIVMISTRDGYYAVASGNPVRKCDRLSLATKLEEIAHADKEALRSKYKQQLRAPKTDDTNGAGLGLLDMARRASAPLSFSFETLDEDFDFFSLTVLITEA